MKWIILMLMVVLSGGMVLADCSNPVGSQGGIVNVFGFSSFCSDPNWDDAKDNIGKIMYTNTGLYDNVAFNNVWYWCDSGNDGSEGVSVPDGVEMNDRDILSIGGHDYVCFWNGIYETIAECCGDGICNSDSAGERYSTGGRVVNFTCQADGSWLEESLAEDDTVLKLSTSENAHAELYDGSNYFIEVKYSEIFGESFTGNPHPVCEGVELLKLSSTTNAHAEKGSLDNYDYGVCYGDLYDRCEYKADCLFDEASVVTIASDSNAHVTEGDAITGYATKLCCDICPPGYVYSFGVCEPSQDECFAFNTRGNYVCFTDGLYTHPFDCFGLEDGPRYDRPCCEGCLQGWDYNCWVPVVIY